MKMSYRVTPKFLSSDSSSDTFIKPSPDVNKLSEYDQKLLNVCNLFDFNIYYLFLNFLLLF